MKKITPQTERKLMGVLEKVAVYTDEGLHPNDAIVKAGSGQLRPGEVELVVRAYNVGKTNTQRESSDSILEKTAEFDMADADVVTSKLFPREVKTAAQHTISTAVSPDYSQSAKAVARQIKAAQAPVHEWPAPPPSTKQAYAKSDSKAYDRQVGDLQRATKDYETKRAAHQQSVWKLASAVDAFGDAFRDNNAPSQATVKTAAAILHGQSVVDRVFDSVYASQPGLATIASAKRPVTKIAASDRTLQLFNRVLECAQDCRMKAAAAAEAKPVAMEKHAAMYPAKSAAIPFGSSLLDNPIEKKVQTKVALDDVFSSLSWLGKTLDDKATRLREYADKRTDPEPDINNALTDLTDPDHEEKLRELQAQTSFQELLARDPILRGYQPTQVADAFGQISQAAPNLSTQPLAMQALMRKQLEQGHMDTFDVNDMIGMNNDLQDRFSGMNDMNKFDAANAMATGAAAGKR